MFLVLPGANQGTTSVIGVWGFGCIAAMRTVSGRKTWHCDTVGIKKTRSNPRPKQRFTKKRMQRAGPLDHSRTGANSMRCSQPNHPISPISPSAVVWRDTPAGRPSDLWLRPSSPPTILPFSDVFHPPTACSCPCSKALLQSRKACPGNVTSSRREKKKPRDYYYMLIPLLQFYRSFVDGPLSVHVLTLSRGC